MNHIKDYKREQDNFFENVQDLALDFGEKIQTARKSQGYNRKKFAEILNIKESHLKNIEYQNTQPNVEVQKKIERTLSIDLTAEEIEY